MFPLFKWKHYTKISDLSIDVTAKGHVRISLWGINRKNDDVAAFESPVLLKTVENKSDETGVTNILTTSDFSSLPDFIYLTLATEEAAVVEDISFSTSTARNTEINIACCFCTYKREDDIRRNVQNLLSGIVRCEDSCLKDRLHIYIADNAHTLPLDLYDKELPVHIFHNRNYGGSGGFTRCMIEACFRNQGKPFSHIILMDDDAVILLEVVERTGALLGILKEEYTSHMVGGGLIAEESPALQVENGVLLSLDGKPSVLCGCNRNLTHLDSVLRNEVSPETEVNYNGWWYTCIPSHLITPNNLPLPLFLHFDDQEYGYRHRKFIRMNGIVAWHPRTNGIEYKRPSICYYNTRNVSIVRAKYVSPEATALKAKQVFSSTIGTAVNYSFPIAFYRSLGLRHFYRGIDFFKSLDPEAWNRQLAQLMPLEPCQVSAEELRDIRPTTHRECSSGPDRSIGAKLRRYLNWMIPAYKGRVVYDNDDLNWNEVDLFGAKEVCIVDRTTGKGFSYRKSYRQLFRAIGMAFCDAMMIARCHKRVYKEWQDSVAELSTYAFWKEYLGI